MRNEYFGDYMTGAVFFLAGLLLVTAAIFTARLVAPRCPSVLQGTAYESGIEPIDGGWNQSHIRYYVFALLFVGVLAVGTSRFQSDAFRQRRRKCRMRQLRSDALPKTRRLGRFCPSRNGGSRRFSVKASSTCVADELGDIQESGLILDQTTLRPGQGRGEYRQADRRCRER